MAKMGYLPKQALIAGYVFHLNRCRRYAPIPAVRVVSKRKIWYSGIRRKHRQSLSAE